MQRGRETRPLTLNSALAFGLFSLGMLAGFATARPQPAGPTEPSAQEAAFASIVPMPSFGDTTGLDEGAAAEPAAPGAPMHAAEPSVARLEAHGRDLEVEDLPPYGPEEGPLAPLLARAAEAAALSETALYGPAEAPGFGLEHDDSSASALAAADELDLEADGFEAPVALDVVFSEGELGDGESLSVVMNAHGVSRATIQWITGELSPIYDFHRSRPGHRFRLVQSPAGEVLDFRYQHGRNESLHIQATERGFRIVMDVVGIDEAPDPLVALAELQRGAPPADVPAEPELEMATVIPVDPAESATRRVDPAVSLAEKAERYVPASVAPPQALPSRMSAADGLIEGTLARGQTLSQALRSRGVSSRLVHRIDRAARPVYDFRKAQPGHRFHLKTDASGEIVRFRYRMSSDVAIQLMPVANGDGGTTLVATRIESPMHTRQARIAGVVVTTLYDAIASLGEDPQLAETFSSIFAWELDFARNVQAGDEFRILYERRFWVDPDGRERPAQLGRILAASYRGQSGDFEAIYFEPINGRGGYYRRDGSSVEREFLAAPLEYSRIASSYSSSRFHPILKVNRPHHGIDYAAPRGTPVWAVASGKVVYRGRAGSFGNLVKVEHHNGLISYYTHLQGFAKGLQVGDRVRQKQELGYVGSSGLATGPHVCFRVTRNGRYVNPLRIDSPAGAPIREAERGRFKQQTGDLLARLSGATVLAME